MAVIESKELTNIRREEIMDACESLYEEKGYRAITIKDISTVTSFSRPSIYNYFQTKEEIFLGILTREYMKWNMSLKNISELESRLEPDKLADEISKSMEERKTLLKISAMNLYEIEENSRDILLIDYKREFKKTVELFDKCLSRHLTDVSEEKRAQIRYAFFPYMYGIYPYAYPTDKQLEAMDTVGLSYKRVSIYDLTYQFLSLIF